MSTKPKPRNGKHFIALVVGGEKILRNKLVTKMAERGIEVKHIWEPSKHLDQKTFPADLDLVFVPRDASLSRNIRDRIAYNARKHAFVVDVTTVAYAEQKLDQAGYDLGESLDLIQLRAKLPPAPAPPPEPEPEPEVEPEAEEDEQEMEAKTPLPPSKREPIALPAAQLAQMERVGRLLRGKRENDKKVSAAQMASSIGCSSGYILNIEQGKGRPSDAMCLAIERYLGIEMGTIPRIATRKNNTRIGVPLGSPDPVVPAYAPAPVPAPAREEAPPRVIAAVKQIEMAHSTPSMSMIIRDTDPEPLTNRSLMLQLVDIQAAMAKLGIIRIEITPDNMSVNRGGGV